MHLLRWRLRPPKRSPVPLNLGPNPVSAALAGAFSAVALPLFSRWQAADNGGGMAFVFGFLLLVALPAHVGVLGLRRAEGQAPRAVDKPLLLRVLAWLGAALGVSLVSLALT